jgi:ribosomal protein S18 acetylase RimI-like enzyme
VRPMSMPRIEDFSPGDRNPLVQMWRQSFEAAVGIVDPHPIEEQIDYFDRNVLAKNRVRAVKDAGLIVGFMASTRESVSQLYVRVGHQRRGIGRQLLGLAKDESDGTLWLYTFARNTNACAFYDSQGFKVVQRGFEPAWQLEDVKYAWSNAGRAA